MEKPRYEREIEELLRGMDDFLPEPTTPSRPVPRPGALLRSLLDAVDVGKLAAVGLLLLLVGIVGGGWLGPMASGIILVGAVMLVAAYFLFFFGGRRPRLQRGWRGRLIDYEREPTLVEQWVGQVLHRLRRH